jgi:hypothetical protein
MYVPKKDSSRVLIFLPHLMLSSHLSEVDGHPFGVIQIVEDLINHLNLT